MIDRDPFFSIGPDPNWNACIGRQGDEENYADGFLEASVELIDALFEKKLYGKRDTLVLPILYNARHGIELSLKMAIRELVGMGVIAPIFIKTHDILSHWKHLNEAKLGDNLLRSVLRDLEPFVTSLAKIDDDGQELRYHETQKGTQSLQGHAVTSLILIRDSLKELYNILKRLKHRLYDLRHERRGGFFTPELSRRDLIEIANLLPSRNNWSSSSFDEVKGRIREIYSLSNRNFSAALDIIQNNREARMLIGLETDLVFLSDEKVRFLADAFLELYPPKSSDSNRRLVSSFEDLDFASVFQDRQREGAIYQKALKSLSAEEVADIRAIFYLGRDRELPECYESSVGANLRGLSTPEDLTAEFVHVFSKVNFLYEFKKGLRVLGKESLAASLDTSNELG